MLLVNKSKCSVLNLFTSNMHTLFNKEEQGAKVIMKRVYYLAKP